MRRTVRCRQRSLRRALTWDGITDEEILARDGWRCQVPMCLYRSRKIDRQRKYPDPRSKGIDHIVPLSLGGDDTCVNKRAAHHGCNMARGNQMGYEQLLLIGSLREPPLSTEVAGTIRERRPPKTGKSPRLCACGEPIGRRGRAECCPDCMDKLSEQIQVMRRMLTWQEISDELSLSGPGRAYQLAVYYPKERAQRGNVA